MYKYDVVQFLMESHAITQKAAEQIREEMRERVLEGDEDPDEVLLEEGMEPDYLESLLGV